MVEMTKREWWSRAWASQFMLFMGSIPFPFNIATWPITALTFGLGTILFPWFMWGDAKTKTLPAGFIADRAVKVWEFSPGETLKMVFITLIAILDVAETPGGVKIDEETLDTWRTTIKDENNWLTTKYDIYWWDYWDWNVISGRTDIISNESGDYKFWQLLLDIGVFLTAIILVIIFAKQGSTMAARAGKMFSKNSTKRRRRNAKGREELALQKMDELLAELNITKQAIQMSRTVLQQDVDEEILPELATIKAQTKKKTIRL